MPKMNGLEATFHINKFFKTQNNIHNHKNNICIHSAYVNEDTKASAKKLNIEYIIKKPCKLEILNPILIKQKVITE
jgi:CheY-like chemotaxis protein